ncbi:MAG TPA: UpxY family transcription antiterminator [Daejeonella sp.]|nr:UpxY family transcription antiterminator [Daejeonella sp.]
MINSNQYNWYPVYTNPRAEKKVTELLSRKGIEAYLPLCRQLKVWSDRKKWVEEPLIKSYVFIKISEHQKTEVLSTRGVCRFLYFSGRVATMPQRQIEQLKLLMATEAELDVIDYKLEKGTQVRVKAGTLQGLTGQLVEFRSEKKVMLKIEHTGHFILIQIPTVFLEPIE